MVNFTIHFPESVAQYFVHSLEPFTVKDVVTHPKQDLQLQSALTSIAKQQLTKTPSYFLTENNPDDLIQQPSRLKFHQLLLILRPIPVRWLQQT
jgi:hypothetical protein